MKVTIDIPEDALCALWMNQWGEKQVAAGIPSPTPEALCRTAVQDAAAAYLRDWKPTPAQITHWRSTLEPRLPDSPWMTKAEVCAFFRRAPKWVDFWSNPARNGGAIPAMPRIGASNKGAGKSAAPSFYAPAVTDYLLRYHQTPTPKP